MLQAEKERGAGILMSTHALDTAEKYFDRFIILADRTIIYQGTFQNLKTLTHNEHGDLLDCFTTLVQNDGDINMVDLNSLYKNRKIKINRKQKELLFSLFEWTYFIYVILPIGLLSVYGYFYMWWANPSWINTVQLPLIHIILFIIIYTSNLRTHLEYADQLFLARNIPIMDSMIQKGVLSLLKTELIKIILIFIMIMPYL